MDVGTQRLDSFSNGMSGIKHVRDHHALVATHLGKVGVDTFLAIILCELDLELHASIKNWLSNQKEFLGLASIDIYQ